MMTKKQPTFVIGSVEEGVQLVRQSTNVAVVAGRETLFFDVQRFGNLMVFIKHKFLQNSFRGRKLSSKREAEYSVFCNCFPNWMSIH